MSINKAINKPQPACKYCSRAIITADSGVILCRKRGSVSVDDSCRRFKYDPLKRQPGTMPELGSFTADQFIL
ncbi:MAG: hypothetical protein IIW23_02470 [Clostridia bacterium]|nr:hypothetical protein [Clostridia bacterium]